MLYFNYSQKKMLTVAIKNNQNIIENKLLLLDY